MADLSWAVQDAALQREPGPRRTLETWLQTQTAYKLSKGDDASDIVIPSLGTYAFPADLLEEFFERVEGCRRAKVWFQIMEKQRPDRPSGLLIDLDLVQRTPERQFTPNVIQQCVSVLMKELDSLVRLPQTPVHIFISQRPKITKIPSEGDTTLTKWKDGLHIAVPSLLMDRGLKKYVMQQLSQSLLQKSLHGKTDINVEEALDLGAASAPMLLQGAAKREREPYQIVSVWEFASSEGGFPIIHNHPEYLDPNCQFNLSFEASLNYTAVYQDGRDPLVTKTRVDEQPAHESQVRAFREREKQLLHKSPHGMVNLEELLDVEETVSLLSVQDPDARDLWYLLRIIPPEFVDHRNKWRDVIFAIANTSERYYCLAEWFTQRLPKRWNRDELPAIWEHACSRKRSKLLPTHLDTDNTDTGAITIRSLHHWARAARPDDYQDALANTYQYRLYENAIASDGELTDLIKANLLYSLLKDTFAVVRINSVYHWYEFVRPSITRDGTTINHSSEVFKWRYEGEQPSSLLLYLMERVPIILRRIVDQIKTKQDEAREEKRVDTVKWYQKTIVNLKKSGKNLENIRTASTVLRTAAHIFYSHNRDFARLLNADPMLLGVGNGVLRLSAKPELLRGFHEHYVSLKTEARWRPYDPNDEWTRYVEERFAEMYPEPDALNFIWKYWASSLDGRVKESLFLVIHAPGGEGKSTALESMLGALGELATKLSQGLLVGEREKSNEANAAKMDIMGKRFGYFSELDKDTPVTEGQFKEMTGGETMNGRSPYDREQKKFQPTMRYALITNKRLIPQTNTHGFWRRLLWYYGKVRFVDNPDPLNPMERKADPTLLEKTIHTQEWKDAFLSILVHHYVELQTKYGGHLRNVPAPSIQKDTEHYRNQFDVINRFICEKVVQAPADKKDHPRYRSDLRGFQAELSQWCMRAEGATIKHLSPDEVTQELRESRIKRFIENSHGELFVRGLRVLSAHEEPDPDECGFQVQKIPTVEVEVPPPPATTWEVVE